ncbi:hypothetical protein QJS10_CPB04g00308 [Acorus calamus]|uniref:AWPM-19-like family protein n=1 Tax=Acorus calamus TaxID=4465 RepID=A0AAV9F4W0_ACOCL|nr:hypothetical protein QJS10_CPB04g00308 [Acorus calamus]
MALAQTKTPAFFLLFVNLVMYLLVTAISGWALSSAINNTFDSASALSINLQPGISHHHHVRLFPMYFPVGNMATGFFVFFSLIAGLVGIAASVSGLNNVLQWNTSNLLSSAASSIMAWSLTLLAMGLAWKEFSLGGRGTSLRTLEALAIILSGTQLLCAGLINVGASDVLSKPRYMTGRV